MNSLIYCSECKKSFISLSNLRRHIKTFHPATNVTLAAPLKRDNLEFKFHCNFCKRRFNQLTKIRYHIRHYHGESPDETSKTIVCPLCACNCYSRTSILEHLKIHHSTVVENKTLLFSSLEKFLLWKEETEKVTRNVFVRSAVTDFKTYYKCQRSGFYRPKGKGYREKRSPSIKINAFCPARIVLSLKDGVYTADFTETHVGHSGDLVHLYFIPKEQESFATKSAMKIPFKNELKKQRNGISENDYDDNGQNDCDENRQNDCDENGQNDFDENEQNYCDENEQNDFDENGQRYCDENGQNYCDENEQSIVQRKKLMKKQANEAIDMISSFQEMEAVSQLISSIKPTIMAVRSIPSTSVATISSAPNKKRMPKKE